MEIERSRCSSDSVFSNVISSFLVLRYTSCSLGGEKYENVLDEPIIHV
jgi:hypothetical protein